MQQTRESMLEADIVVNSLDRMLDGSYEGHHGRIDFDIGMVNLRDQFKKHSILVPTG